MRPGFIGRLAAPCASSAALGWKRGMRAAGTLFRKERRNLEYSLLARLIEKMTKNCENFRSFLGK